MILDIYYCYTYNIYSIHIVCITILRNLEKTYCIFYLVYFKNKSLYPVVYTKNTGFKIRMYQNFYKNEDE